MNILPSKIIIEGIDRMGKTTLINHLINYQPSFYRVLHSGRPFIRTSDRQILVRAESDDIEFRNDKLRLFQLEYFEHFFQILQSKPNFIFDRGHLGEVVYSPLYRNYNGEYVYELEKTVNKDSTLLILLTTSDFSFIKDDGLSFDFSKKEEEQQLFIDAFNKSSLNKIQIDISKNNSYKNISDIYNEVLSYEYSTTI